MLTQVDVEVPSWSTEAHCVNLEYMPKGNLSPVISRQGVGQGTVEWSVDSGQWNCSTFSANNIFTPLSSQRASTHCQS